MEHKAILRSLQKRFSLSVCNGTCCGTNTSQAVSGRMPRSNPMLGRNKVVYIKLRVHVL
jgi:hypothetical protein